MADWPGAPAPDEVHLWQAPLDLAWDLQGRMAEFLSQEELERSARLRRDLDRARFVAARGWLRMLLARYLDVAASEIVLAAGPHGKPRLALGPESLRFNLAHSDGVAVYAVARDREVGVDVERLRPDFPIDEIARHYFSPQEQADLGALPEADRLRAAFDCWTRKEAYLKAAGVGLTQPLEEFDVTFRPGESVVLRINTADGDGGGRWTLHAFDAGRDYSAAVAVEGDPCSVPDAAPGLAPLLPLHGQASGSGPDW